MSGSQGEKMKEADLTTSDQVLHERAEKIIGLLEEIAKSNRQMVRRLDELTKIRAAVDYSAELNEIKLGVFAIKDFHQGQRA